MDNQKLLYELKNKLAITWDDIDLEKNLKSIIEDAKFSLDFKLGADIDYSIPGMEHKLFLNYCMYDYNNCLNEFDKNYLNEIYQLRAKWTIRRKYEKN